MNWRENMIIKKAFIDSLLAIHKKLKDSEAKWAVGGDLGEAMRRVEVEPDCIEILTNKEGVKEIFEKVKDHNPTEVKFLEQKLSRNAIIKGQDYPVYIRSHYFEFYINGVKVKVHGDLQFKVDDWDWGDVLEFDPEYVYIVGAKTAVVPLSVKSELYQSLGWIDRVEKIKIAIFPRRKKLI
jgi:hypothetical protein